MNLMINWDISIGNLLLAIGMVVGGFWFLARMDTGLALLKQEVSSIKDDLHKLADTAANVAAMGANVLNMQDRVTEMDRRIERNRSEFEQRINQVISLFSIKQHDKDGQ